MSNRTRRHTERMARPSAEGLETRQLLASHLVGLDIDGDRWVLDLTGPGDFNVTKHADASGDRVPLDEPGLIDTISIAGTGPKTSRLVGQVFPGPNGDGKVFFQNLNEFGGNSQFVNGSAGMLAIDMPDFWLGITNPTPTAGQEAPAIDVPDGVVTLRFGGVDATAFFGSDQAARPNANNTADSYNVRLGLPFFAGTSIIVDSVISDAQRNAANNNVVQDSVTFSVGGRLNLFEANTIRGNAALGPTPFSATGGTVVRSVVGGGGVTSAIGEIRINGSATNFFTQLQAAGGGVSGGTERLKTFFIGGEATNVSLDAPGGARLVKFGRGADTVNINTHVIEAFEANRSAINSEIVVERTIGRMTIGGDAINTRVFSGYIGAPGDTPQAQIGGGMTVLIGGDVRNSIFAASVDPQGASEEDGTRDTGFGGLNDILIPGATIDAKVEGRIDNSEVAPTRPQKAFFASGVRLERGPVIPPTVPEPPFSHPFPRPRSIGVPQLRGSLARAAARRQAQNLGSGADASAASQTRALRVATPGGPLAVRNRSARS